MVFAGDGVFYYGGAGGEHVYVFACVIALFHGVLCFLFMFMFFGCLWYFFRCFHAAKLRLFFDLQIFF